MRACVRRAIGKPRSSREMPVSPNRQNRLQPPDSPAASTLRAIAQRRSPSGCTGFRVSARAGYPHRRRSRRSIARPHDAIHVRESFTEEVSRAKRAVFVEIACPIYFARGPLAECGLRCDAVPSRCRRCSVRQRRKRESAPAAFVIERVALRVPFVLHHRLLVEPAHCFRRPPIGTSPLRSAAAVGPWRVVAIGLSSGVPFADGFTVSAGRKDECGGIDNAWKDVTGQHGGDDVAMECASILVR